ncbi:hypothetical protein DSO57_1025800 [Entomophthora muscae]|uniref:Uncharacterized protein n=1 Tax=Entomophthora muscae TaxID=34485 RepID=A0ACC2SRX4_9FUNG|nr:hypothetical protein DSO57_1025800 [Entomophthora muscae]
MDCLHPSFSLLPDHVLERIFYYLDIPNGSGLHLVCREVYGLILPMLLQVHTLGNVGSMEYRRFLLKNSKHIRGLIIKDIALFSFLQEAELCFHEIFSNLRSISLRGQVASSYGDWEAFCRQCFELKLLKHISLCGMESDETHIDKCDAIDYRSESDEESNPDFDIYTPYTGLIPLMPKLQSFYTSFFPLSLISHIRSSHSMKKLAIASNCYRPLFLKLRKLIPAKEVQLFNPFGPIISSTDATNQTWVYSSYSKTHYYWRLRDRVVFQESELAKRIFPNFYRIEEDTDFGLLERIMDDNPMEHCTIISVDDDEIIEDKLMGLEKIASIEMVFRGPAEICLEDSFYAAKALSLDISGNGANKFIGWAFRKFPDLQHLYIGNEIPNEMFPLEKTFESLECFYSSVPQSDEFWNQLVRNAPKLSFVYTDCIRGCYSTLKAIRPVLKILPFKTIHGTSRILEEVPAFYESLLNR